MKDAQKMMLNPSPETVEFMKRRRSVVAKAMIAVDIPPADLDEILTIGTRVPDHGKQAPWRIVVIQGDSRGRIGREVLAPRFAARNPDAAESTVELEARRFERAGCVLAVISAPTEHPKVPVWEMELSAGAVCAHLTIAAQAKGFAAQWLTEWTAFDDQVLTALGGAPGRERIAGFIYIGEAPEAPAERPRPDLGTVVSYL